MNKNWQEYLLAQGAVLDSNGYLDFQNTTIDATISKQDHCYDLSHLGLIRANGEDALDFLHGQFTNDLKLVSNEISQLSSYCNPKGRMLAIFRIFKRNDDYYLLLRKDVIEAVLKKLNMFKLMAKVELTDASDELIVMGLSGSNAEILMNKINLPIPENLNESITNNQTTVINSLGTESRFLLISPPEEAISNWTELTESCTQTSYETWELIDIQNGIPHVTAETSEAFIPQMVNLELIGGVNFQKGCYPGQEIVARTHYLGKPNRRMYRITIENSETPSVGTNIFSKADGEQAVGKIVNAQSINDNACEALAVLRTEKETAQDLYLAGQADNTIKFLSLPYSLNET